MALRIEYVPLDEVSRWPRNPKGHSEEIIAQSFERFGYVMPILVDEATGRLVAGHGRLDVLQSLARSGAKPPERVKVKGGAWLVPVIRGVEFGSEHEAEAYLVGDNAAVIAGGWDDALLTEILRAVQETTEGLKGTGFDEESLAEIEEQTRKAARLADLTAHQEQLEGDQTPATPDNPVTKSGDLWLLGSHRIICGDATIEADVSRVLSGNEPRLLVTDPPYGVAYDPEWRHRAGVNKSDRRQELDGDENDDWRGAYALFPGDVAYVWHASLHTDVVLDGLCSVQVFPRALIVWVKQKIVFSRGHYHWRHELCWYGVRKGATAQWAGDRKQSTVWEIDAPIGAAGNDDESTFHATQKPVECMARPIRNHQGHVYDPFLGSGTTLIAAEQLERTCYGIEIRPAYCDVIVGRWQNLTGGEARLEATGQTFSEVAAERAKAPSRKAGGKRRTKSTKKKTKRKRKAARKTA